MASEKQIAANRRNAGRSTGPKTADGKGRVRLNALKHGLTAATVVLPGEDAAALEARVEAWKDDVQPRRSPWRTTWSSGRRTPPGSSTAPTAPSPPGCRADATRADRPRRTGRPTRSPTLARRLFWDPLGPDRPVPPRPRSLGPPRGSPGPTRVDDPLNPARIVNRLEALAAGCRWLLDRWGELRKILEDGRRSGSRPTGCGPSACWAGSRWTPSTTSGCCRSTWPAARWTLRAGRPSPTRCPRCTRRR